MREHGKHRNESIAYFRFKLLRLFDGDALLKGFNSTHSYNNISFLSTKL